MSDNPSPQTNPAEDAPAPQPQPQAETEAQPPAQAAQPAAAPPPAARAATLESVATTTPKISEEEKAARGLTLPQTSHSRDTQTFAAVPAPDATTGEESTGEGETTLNYFFIHPQNAAILREESRTLPPIGSRIVFIAGLPLVVAGLALIVYTIIRWNAIIPAVQAGTTTPPNTLLNGALWTLGAFLFNVFVLGLYVSALGVVMKRRRLEERGQVVRGEVVSATGQLDRAGDLTITVAYRFQQPERRRKRTLEGKVREQRNDLKDRALPAPGTPIAVLYLNPDNYELL